MNHTGVVAGRIPRYAETSRDDDAEAAEGAADAEAAEEAEEEAAGAELTRRFFQPRLCTPRSLREHPRAFS